MNLDTLGILLQTIEKKPAGIAFTGRVFVDGQYLGQAHNDGAGGQTQLTYACGHTMRWQFEKAVKALKPVPRDVGFTVVWVDQTVEFLLDQILEQAIDRLPPELQRGLR